ncbi:MAG TPA: CHRD domain-containing protein [Rudaea sp.]|nr:CHRD domain-containing protein [Rudaea sp.]
MSRFGAAIAAALLATTGVAPAAPVVYFGNLTGAAESPANASPATGFTLVTVDSVAQTLEVNVSFSGLLGTATAAHVHCCTTDPGTSTAAVATTTPSFANFPLGVTSGAYDRTLDLTLASSYNTTFITNNGGTVAGAEAALLSGIAAVKAYLDIHTTFSPGGEIRSFLIPDLIFVSGMEAL